MKNKEKFASEIVEIAINNVNGRIAINKRTGIPVACYRFDCNECLFGCRLYSEDCKGCLLKWAEAEYKEIVTAETASKRFLNFCSGRSCVDCKYSNISRPPRGCQIRFVFDNYNVTEKEAEDAE